MHLTKALFSAEEALARLGQLRETGCLVIVSAHGTSRVFTREAFIINAYSKGQEGLSVLENCFEDVEASYTWIPGAAPVTISLNININAHVLKNAIAKDIHLSKTAKVSLNGVDQSTIPPGKSPIHYFLTADNQTHEKFPLNKGTLIIGRDASCDIIISETKVSRRHCLIQVITRGLSFRDLESSNGLFINGIPAKEGFMQPGDKLTLGDFTFIVGREKG